MYVARGNGKSELGAAIVCNGLFLDDEPGAQLYGAAAKRDQTRFIFDPVKRMIRNCAEMNSRATIYQYAIVSGDKSYKVISREATTEHGGATQLAVIDELHAQPDRELVDVLLTSTIKRRQPLIVYFTTADFQREGSICNEKYAEACRVRDGILPNPSFLPCIYEAARDADWTLPETWKKANPNLGVTIKEQDLAELCRKAQELPSFQNTFMRLHCNIITESDVRWLPMDKWDDCGEPFDENILEGETCYAGLDLSSTRDITALVLVFPKDDLYYVLPYFWIPGESAIKREQRDRVPYPVWIRNEHIYQTPGDTVRYEFVRKKINELRERFNIIEIAADRWNATQILTDLEGDGFEIIAYGQGFKDMTAPAKELEVLVVDGRLRHGGHPVLRWMASNVSVETDAAGNIKPSKKKSSERIDGIVATCMGLGRAMLTNSDADRSLAFI